LASPPTGRSQKSGGDSGGRDREEMIDLSLHGTSPATAIRYGRLI